VPVPLFATLLFEKDNEPAKANACDQKLSFMTSNLLAGSFFLKQWLNPFAALDLYRAARFEAATFPRVDGQNRSPPDPRQRP
jgi:hypothetical protein